MILVNELQQFATVNYLWTMAAISVDDYNDGTWKSFPRENIILSSAGRYSGQRVETVSGKPEFFVDTFQIDTFTTPTSASGNTGQIGMSFQVFEPYSVGLFLQSCFFSAINAGHDNYLSAPYVIRLDIEGQTTTNEFKSMPPHYFRVTLESVEFETTHSGCQYTVKAIPSHAQAARQDVNSLLSDFNVESSGAKDAIEKLFEYQTAQSKRAGQEHVYKIEFPAADWQSPNPFDDTFDFQSGSQVGTSVFSGMGSVYDTSFQKIDRSKINPSASIKRLQFSKQSSILNCINSIIKETRYARTEPVPDDAGMITWWRIGYLNRLSNTVTESRNYRQEYIFQVIPVKVHYSAFANPNLPIQGLSALESMVAKEYSYIYTGENTEVLEWRIKVQNLVYTLGLPNKANETLTDQGASTAASVQAPNSKIVLSSAPANTSKPQDEGNPGNRVLTSNGPRLSPVSAAGRNDTASNLATLLYDSILERVDQIALDITVMGDPWFLPSSELSTDVAGGSQTDAAGTMNHLVTEIFISIIFKTPIDSFNHTTGLYEFQEGELNSPFSGIYRIDRVESKFDDNRFTQRIFGSRIPDSGRVTTTTSTVDPQIQNILRARARLADDNLTDNKLLPYHEELTENGSGGFVDQPIGGA